MRFGRNRTGVATGLDWVAIFLMMGSGMAMWVLAMFYFFAQNTQFIVLLVFGFIAMTLRYADYRAYKHHLAVGKKRLSRHLTNRMGGMIAVVAAA